MLSADKHAFTFTRMKRSASANTTKQVPAAIAKSCASELSNAESIVQIRLKARSISRTEYRSTTGR
ncbi:MAG: hypothetical protein WA855_12920, partial [Candidatus Acidiferrales bacterium]